MVIDVRNCKYRRGAVECTLDGSDVIQIRFHNLHSLRGQLLGCGRGRVSGDVTNVPALEIEEGICDKGPLVSHNSDDH